jgi:hypothetical protein
VKDWVGEKKSIKERREEKRQIKHFQEEREEWRGLCHKTTHPGGNLCGYGSY